jgi:hypothetical protein
MTLVPNRGANTRRATNCTAGAISGTASNTIDTADGVFQAWSSGAVSGNSAGGIPMSAGGTGNNIQPRWLPAVFIKFRTPADLTSQRLFAGVATAAPGTADSPNTLGCVLLRYSTSVPETTFKIYHADGTTGNTVDTGVTVAADTSYCLALVWVSTTSVQVWFGTSEATMTLIATLATTLPTASASLTPILNTTTLTAAARAVAFGRLKVAHV